MDNRDSIRFIPLARFSTAAEADVFRSVLESHNIPTIADNEIVVTWAWYLSNAIGGIRMPTIELPQGAYLGNNSGGEDGVFCSLYGSFLRFGRAELDERYPDHDLYVRQMETEVSRSVSEGFLLPTDGATLVAEASKSDVGVRVEGSSGGGAMGLGSLLLLLVAGLFGYGRSTRR